MTLLNIVATACPSGPTATKTITAIRATMMPYSTIVAPFSEVSRSLTPATNETNESMSDDIGKPFPDK